MKKSSQETTPFDGFSEIFQCPHCGTYKTLYGCNIYMPEDLTTWSDLRRENIPVHPYRSMIQRCPNCGRYYLFNNDYCMYYAQYPAKDFYQLGKLPLKHLRMAFQQLPEHEANSLEVLKEYVWAFNDLYGTKEKDEIPHEEWIVFDEVVRKMIPLEKDQIMIAEWFRELGEFDMALKALKNLKVEPEQRNWRAAIRIHARCGTRTVFKVKGNCQRKAITMKNYHEEVHILTKKEQKWINIASQYGSANS